MAVNWIEWERLLTGGTEGFGSTARDLAISQAVDNFLAGMVDDPGYQADALVEGTQTPILTSRTSALECEIKAAPGTDLHTGDLVQCLGEDWIVVELYADKVGILNGVMWICNNIIRFQNHSSPVNRRLCIIDDGSYSKRSSDPMVYVPNNTYKMYLAIDAATLKLYIDKRLALGKIYDQNLSEVLEVYKIIGIDLRSQNLGEGSHLMMVTLQRDVYNEETDSLEDLLCDVYVEPNNTSEKTATGSCVIIGRDAIRLGTSRQYSVVFSDAKGETVDNVEAEWEIDIPSEVSEQITYSFNEGILSVSVPLVEELIGTEITMRVADSDGLYGTYEKKVRVVTVG